jgi:hypothetical protein
MLRYYPYELVQVLMEEKRRDAIGMATRPRADEPEPPADEPEACAGRTAEQSGRVPAVVKQLLGQPSSNRCPATAACTC